MADFSDTFKKSTAEALGLGLEVQIDPERAAKDWREDPADAFTRAAATFQSPGNYVPIPFATTFAGETPHSLVPENQDRLSRKEKKACHKQDLTS